MSRLHSRLERMRAKVREVVAQEVPGVPVRSLQAIVHMPYPDDDADLVFFYGEGVVAHADFDYATTRLSDLLREDGIETAFARVSRQAYEAHVQASGSADSAELRLGFLSRACGARGTPDSIVSCPLFSPAVVAFQVPGSAARAQVLVI